MIATVRKDKLQSLTTADLIAQYQLAISSSRGRYSNTAPRQKRIDFIVYLLDQRADQDDADAVQFFTL
jgi:hypothetical protein